MALFSQEWGLCWETHTGREREGLGEQAASSSPPGPGCLAGAGPGQATPAPRPPRSLPGLGVGGQANLEWTRPTCQRARDKDPFEVEIKCFGFYLSLGRGIAGFFRGLAVSGGGGGTGEAEAASGGQRRGVREPSLPSFPPSPSFCPAWRGELQGGLAHPWPLGPPGWRRPLPPPCSSRPPRWAGRWQEQTACGRWVGWGGPGLSGFGGSREPRWGLAWEPHSVWSRGGLLLILDTRPVYSHRAGLPPSLALSPQPPQLSTQPLWALTWAQHPHPLPSAPWEPTGCVGRGGLACCPGGRHRPGPAHRASWAHWLPL